MKKLYTIILALIILLPVSLSGQSLLTHYFVDNSTMSHNLNPAFAPVQGYIGMPILSSINLNLESNIGMNNIMYPLDNGKLGLFLHPEVSSEQFLSTLPAYTYLNPDVNVDVINMGFKSGEKSYWTVGIGFKVNVDSYIPDEFFKLLKVGMVSDPTQYSIKNFSFIQDAYAQASLGYSREFFKGFRAGAKVKFLAVADQAYVSIDELNVSMGSDAWSASSKASAYILGKGLDFVKDENGRITSFAFDQKNLGVAGFGGAVDLGVSYRVSVGSPVDGLTVSASVTDLGIVSYSAGSVKMAQVKDGHMKHEGFKNIDVKNMNLKEQFDAILKEMFSLVGFEETASSEGQTKFLSTKVYCGVEYPFLKDKMSVGLLYSGRFGAIRNHHELTFSYNYRPTYWFDVSLSYSFLNYAKTFGWLLNFTPKKGVNFFIGSDYMCFVFSPQGIPVDKAYLNAHAGISFPIGK